MKIENNLVEEKKLLRTQIATKKKEVGKEELTILSNKIIARLEELNEFNNSNSILAYFSLPSEVNTIEAIQRWSLSKEIYLPVVIGDDLVVRKYRGMEHLHQGNFNVWEPIGENINNLSIIDMIIIPGVAFSKEKMRMGYGKGFYDRLLPKLSAKKVGICFDFQLFEQIPTEKHDQSIDLIVSELQIVL